jgi:hypothetical protein
MHFWMSNVLLANITHMAAGFGLAILLQYYIKGNSLFAVRLGWWLILLSAAMYIIAFFS